MAHTYEELRTKNVVELREIAAHGEPQSLDLVVQVTRLSDGTRRITSIVEVTGMEGAVTATQEIYHFRRQGISPDGNVQGVFEATGIRPQFTERLVVAGVNLPLSMFSEGFTR